MGFDWVVICREELFVLFAESLGLAVRVDGTGVVGVVEEPVNGTAEFGVGSGDGVLEELRSGEAVELSGVCDGVGLFWVGEA